MSYIGNTVENQNYVPAIDYFNGDGSTVAFTLSRPVASVAAVQAVISNVPQNPGSAFTVSGSTITFTSAPPSGTANIYVYYTSPNTQVVQPGQGTVGTTQLQSDLTLTNPSYTGTLTGGTGVVNIGSGQFYKDSSGNVGVGTTSPSDKLHVVGNVKFGSAGYAVFNNATNDYTSWINNSAGGGNGNMSFYVGGTKFGEFSSDNTFKFNSGYGSVATAYGCRAWVNFNGTGTVAIRASGNVSSITDNGTGDYTVNFTNAMPDANYTVAQMPYEIAGTTWPVGGVRTSGIGAGSVRLAQLNFNSSAYTDPAYVFVSIFR